MPPEEVQVNIHLVTFHIWLPSITDYLPYWVTFHIGYLSTSSHLPYWVTFLFPVTFHIGLSFIFWLRSILGYLFSSGYLPHRFTLSTPSYSPYRATFQHLVTFHLQRAQNTLAQVVMHSSRYDSATIQLQKLHWLPIKQRIDFKICVLSF